MLRKTCIAFTVLLLQGCYTIGTVQYPTSENTAHNSASAKIIQNTAYVETVDDVNVAPSFWNKMARNIVPLLTLGRIEDQVLVDPGTHKLRVAYEDSSSSTTNFGYYSQTTTTTYTMSGQMACKLESGKRYNFESDWAARHIALRPEDSKKEICVAHHSE